MALDPLAEKVVIGAAIKAKQQQQNAAGKPAHHAAATSSFSRYTAVVIWLAAIASLVALAKGS